MEREVAIYPHFFTNSLHASFWTQQDFANPFFRIINLLHLSHDDHLMNNPFIFD